MIQFEVGKTYYTRSICDYDTIYAFEILRRTAQTVWVEVRGKVVARRLSVHDNAEAFRPFGSYSMAAIITADKPCKVEEPETEQHPQASYEVITETPTLEPVDFSPLKSRAVSVKLSRAEGLTRSLMTITVESRYVGEEAANVLEQANSVLRMWALAFPPHGSDKVDFEITFEDGEIYKGCYLLEASDRLDASIQKHIHGMCHQYEDLAWYQDALKERQAFLAAHDVS